MKEKKNVFSFSNIVTAILVLVTVAMLIFPNVKAAFIQGLMKVGLFQPGISKVKTPETNDVGQLSADFVDQQGKTITTSSLKGKIVFLNFWATWCPPCIAEMPSVNELYLKYKDNPNIEFLLVDADNNWEKSIGFMNKHQYQLPVYATQSPVPREWYEGSLPTTVILDKKGQVVYKHVGAADYSSRKFFSFVEELMAQ